MKLLPYKKQAAFTFIEILITVSIMVVSLSVGTANYLRFLNKQELYKDGSAIESILRDARSKAQIGFLGNDAIGFCAQLKAIEVLSGQSADDKVMVTARLHCESDYLLVYDSYTVSDAVTVIDQDFQAAYLPASGVNLLFDGTPAASGSAVLSREPGTVIITLDQGGAIDVKYE